MNTIRDQMDRVRPVSIKAFGNESERVRKLIKENKNKLSEIEQRQKKIEADLLEIKRLCNTSQDMLNQTKAFSYQAYRNTNELIWAQNFNSVTENSSWLVDRRFAAGRWAVGYQYLYAVYRILEETHPQSILELGLGQSTKLLGQYVSSEKNAMHRVTEHDPNWIEAFRAEYPLSDHTELVQLTLEKREFREDKSVLVYKGFQEALSDRKYDFISVDAPFGGQAEVYARIDILDLIPDCLEERFVIIVDDYNRQGERNMLKVLEEKLAQNSIPYSRGVYSGTKDCAVICSEELKFICSM